MFTIDEIKKMEPSERLEILKLRAKLHEKKSKVVANIGRIQKTGHNTYDKYKYATESDIKEGITALLSENQLSLDVHPQEYKKEIVPTASGGKQYLFTVDMQFLLTDITTGYFEVYESKGEGTDRGDKALYKAYTGCMKYFFINNFQISSGDDPESGGNVDQFSPPNQAPKTKQYPNNKGQQQNNKSGKGNSRPAADKSKDKPTDTAAEVPPGIKGKWQFLIAEKTGKRSLDGLDNWITKQKDAGLSFEDMDEILQKEMDAALKKKNEPVMGDTSFNPEDIDRDLQVIQGGQG